jgi:K+ transporter
MANCCKKYFVWMICNAETPVEFFKLPTNRVV